MDSYAGQEAMPQLPAAQPNPEGGTSSEPGLQAGDAHVLPVGPPASQLAPDPAQVEPTAAPPLERSLSMPALAGVPASGRTPDSLLPSVEAADAADALKALAAAAWGLHDGEDDAEEGEASGGGGAWSPGASDDDDSSGAGRAPKRRRSVPRSLGGARPAARRQRAAKLWCRHPLDAAQWALVLSQSAIDSRNISLPWTNPGGRGRRAAGGGRRWCCVRQPAAEREAMPAPGGTTGRTASSARVPPPRGALAWPRQPDPYAAPSCRRHGCRAAGG
jgi:hypothetical protein